MEADRPFRLDWGSDYLLADLEVFDDRELNPRLRVLAFLRGLAFQLGVPT